MDSGGTDAAAARKTWRSVDPVSWLERTFGGLGADGCREPSVLRRLRLSRSGTGKRSDMAEARPLEGKVKKKKHLNCCISIKAKKMMSLKSDCMNSCHCYLLYGYIVVFVIMYQQPLAHCRT